MKKQKASRENQKKKEKDAQGESTSAFKILEDNDFELRILSPQTLKTK